MSSGPELFVVCKSCGSEVSPYITECPYCGNRLRKRAPKLDTHQRPVEPAKKQRRREPRLPRMRSGEVPGILSDRRPYATLVLVAAATIMLLVERATRDSSYLFGDLAVGQGVEDEWYRYLTAPFVHISVGYFFGAVVAVMLFGWLLERRNGPLAVIVVALIAGGGGMAATIAADVTYASGANGIALGLLGAYAVQELLDRRAGVDIESDLLGVFAILIVLIPIPAFIDEASWVAGGVGLAAGALLAFPLRWLRRSS